MKILRVVLGLVLVSSFLTGCTHLSREDFGHSGFLPDYSKLRESDKGNYLVWVNPNAPDNTRWREILIDPVAVYLNPKGEIRAINPEELNVLTQKFHNILRDEFSRSHLLLATVPDSNTLRVQIALTDIDPINPDRKYQNSLRMGAGLVVGAATGIPLTGMLLPAEVAGATMEAIFSNSKTGEVYAMVIVRKDVKPTGLLPSDLKKYGPTEKVFKKWATAIRQALEKNVVR